MKLAVLGASGFVGTRLVETILLGQDDISIVPVVRSYSSLAVLARFDTEWKVCDFFDPKALASAFNGCDAVVHTALGDPMQIVRMAESAYKAAEQAGVKRIVVLSSAAVLGQPPPANSDESTPLHERHPMPYNNAKVRAENTIRRLSNNGSVEPVFLRPSIVYGPRSRWVADCANDLISHHAYLVNGGTGICNAIYVDNLIHAILLCLNAPGAAGHSFFVRDQEVVSWLEFYAAIAEGIGMTIDEVQNIAPPIFSPQTKERLAELIATPAIQAALPAIPARVKRIIKSTISSWHAPVQSNPWSENSGSYNISEEMCLLQQCTWKMPIARAVEILGYQPLITFAEGMRHSIDWLSFAGLLSSM